MDDEKVILIRKFTNADHRERAEKPAVEPTLRDRLQAAFNTRDDVAFALLLEEVEDMDWCRRR